jgi:hypothetical protein
MLQQRYVSTASLMRSTTRSQYNTTIQPGCTRVHHGDRRSNGHTDGRTGGLKRPHRYATRSVSCEAAVADEMNAPPKRTVSVKNQLHSRTGGHSNKETFPRPREKRRSPSPTGRSKETNADIYIQRLTIDVLFHRTQTTGGRQDAGVEFRFPTDNYMEFKRQYIDSIEL